MARPRKKLDPTVLSDRQRRILEVIQDAVVLRGYPPSIREIGDAVGLQSTSSVAYQLKELEKKGFLRRDKNKPRAVDVRGIERRHPTRPKKSEPAEPEHTPPTIVPLVGQIAAGQPILAEQNIEDYMPLPKELTGDGDLYMLRVVGESMKDAGILDGDFVVVRKTPTAEIGQFVAAMIDGEATVKQFHQDSTGPWLLPRNASFDPIPADRAKILGRVVSVMRKI